MVSVAPGCTLSVKLPSRSVMVPSVVPLIRMEAPITASPVASCTCPLTTVCAKAPIDRNNPSRRVNILTGNLLFTCFIILLLKLII